MIRYLLLATMLTVGTSVLATPAVTNVSDEVEKKVIVSQTVADISDAYLRSCESQSEQARHWNEERLKRAKQAYRNETGAEFHVPPCDR